MAHSESDFAVGVSYQSQFSPGSVLFDGTDLNCLPRIPWQQYLQEYCRSSGLPLPVWNVVSERRGSRTAWSATVTVRNQQFASRFWFSGSIGNAKDDAAEVALVNIRGAQQQATETVVEGLGQGDTFPFTFEAPANGSTSSPTTPRLRAQHDAFARMSDSLPMDFDPNPPFALLLPQPRESFSRNFTASPVSDSTQQDSSPDVDSGDGEEPEQLVRRIVVEESDFTVEELSASDHDSSRYLQVVHPDRVEDITSDQETGESLPDSVAGRFRNLNAEVDTDGELERQNERWQRRKRRTRLVKRAYNDTESSEEGKNVSGFQIEPLRGHVAAATKRAKKGKKGKEDAAPPPPPPEPKSEPAIAKPTKSVEHIWLVGRGTVSKEDREMKKSVAANSAHVEVPERSTPDPEPTISVEDDMLMSSATPGFPSSPDESDLVRRSPSNLANAFEALTRFTEKMYGEDESSKSDPRNGMDDRPKSRTTPRPPSSPDKSYLIRQSQSNLANAFEALHRPSMGNKQDEIYNDKDAIFRMMPLPDSLNPADRNPPCNTLYVGNLPFDTSEDELKALFSKQRGYKRLCFRTKQNGPMCLVEFEHVSLATNALDELDGHPLHNSVKSGIRLIYSKDTLGVRTGQNSSMPQQNQLVRDESEGNKSLTESSRPSFQWSAHLQSRSTAPSSPRPATIPELMKGTEPGSTAKENAEDTSDIRSVVSRDEDISSMAGTESSVSPLREAATYYLVKRFAEDQELGELFKLSNSRLDEARFIRNHTRLLKSYYLDLQDTGRSAAERLAIRFLRSRSERTRISSKIHQFLVPSETSLQERIDTKVSNREWWLAKMDRWLNELEMDHLDAVQETEVPDHDSSSDDDSEEEISNTLSPIAGTVTHAHLESVAEFLTTNQPFEAYKANLRSFLFPKSDLSRSDWIIEDGAATRNPQNLEDHLADHTSSGRTIPHEHAGTPCHQNMEFERLVNRLHGVPLEHVQISYEDKFSVWNDLKGVIEDHLDETWDWSPFKPRIHRLLADQARLLWRCGCGNIRSENVSKDVAIRLVQALSVGTNGSIDSVSTGPAATSTSSSDGSATGDISLSSTATTLGNNQAAWQGPQYQCVSSQAARQAVSQHLFLVVAGGRNPGSAHRLAQTTVQNLTNAELFQWLRKEYFQLRGFFRSYFGLSVFSHCEFYKFRKFDANEYAPLAQDYPDEKNPQYDYYPKPMKPMPPIDTHEFHCRFNACYTPRPHLHWFHKCKRACSGASRDVIHLLPKRDCELEEDGVGREEFWGIYARERHSFFRIAIYNVICILPCFAFFFVWIFGLGGDLQDASVPIGVTLSGLTMFWGFILLGSPAYRM